MATRRAFLTSLLAASLLARPTWADAGCPAFLSAAMRPDGQYVLCGLSASAQITFEIPLPARGHAAAAHPLRPEAVAFARRPGTFAIVLDCSSGHQKASLAAPAGRHFCGHGAFSAEGDLLFTTENDYDAARGMIGVWDARQNYARVGEFPSGGVGPHDIKRLPGEEVLVVANGGIETHPSTGRAKLNLPTMRANLSYLDFSGNRLSKMELDTDHQRNSIRHLAVSADGGVGFAMQWQGDAINDLPLLGIHRRQMDETVLFDEASVRNMHGYLGSIAFANDGTSLATTSPRRGMLQVYDAGRLSEEVAIADVCGVATLGDAFVVTSGTGAIQLPNATVRTHNLAWDYHLIPVSKPPLH